MNPITLILNGILLFCLLLPYTGHTQSSVPTVSATQLRVPVLIGKETVVSKIKVDKAQGARLQEVCLEVDPLLLKTEGLHIKVYYASSDKDFKEVVQSNWIRFADTFTANKGRAILKGNLPLADKNAYLYVTCTLPSRWPLQDSFTLRSAEIRIDGKRLPIEGKQDKLFFPGVAVRSHMQDSVHTSRIPGLACSNDGTLLAIFDARYESARDLQGHIDIGLHRSTDGGQTWQPMQIAMDMGTWGGLPQKYNGVSDAGILVDRKSGAIYIAATWMHGLLDDNGQWMNNLSDTSNAWNHQWRKKGSQPGYDVKQSSQFMLVKSIDDGVTWSEPVNITAMGKPADFWLWAPAPGNGITLKDGTLVFPTQGRDHTGKPFSNIAYSKDGGETWHASKAAIDTEGGTTECAVVELPDGRLMLNMRANKNKGNLKADNGRAVSTTVNLGASWTEHPSSFNALPEPTCMASLFRHDVHTDDDQTLLLFFNPDDKEKRRNLTLKVSVDDGQSWPRYLQLLLDEGSSRGYSCITSVDKDHIGILYESSQANMVFQKIPVRQLLKGQYRTVGK
ncbi:sialidase family protein [Sphingobacterium deserti]|uniref:exo-alpha-sialidase n=1 Tax=Sphingobacterium deserti TaxID=1229276 RepID=A0A0B8T7X7_9SPHI|nr:sialidase family protein [Sphingobacterium deserti]KGE13940.1 glycosyl hydrolase BNR repeat-containing protein [Sphingobacterium deserti]